MGCSLHCGQGEKQKIEFNLTDLPWHDVSGQYSLPLIFEFGHQAGEIGVEVEADAELASILQLSSVCPCQRNRDFQAIQERDGCFRLNLVDISPGNVPLALRGDAHDDRSGIGYILRQSEIDLTSGSRPVAVRTLALVVDVRVASVRRCADSWMGTQVKCRLKPILIRI